MILPLVQRTPLSWVVMDVSRVAPAQAEKKALALRRA